MAAVVPSFGGYFMAIERVEQQLRLIASALDAAGVRYAVIGGNAVATWVAAIDEHAVRNTKDVDILVDRASLAQIDAAVRGCGYYLDSVGDIPVLLEQSNPKPSRGVHLLIAGERVRATDVVTAPSVDRAVRSDRGYWVIDVASLLTMKLIAFRRHDQVHIEDMIRVGLITPEIRAQIPADLLGRFEEIERTLPEWH